jgi:hypothetical protein
MKFRLGTGFQSQIELLPVANHLFHNGTHLIHLDGIDDVILGFVTVFFRSFCKAIGNLFNPVVQNIRETEQHRCFHIAKLKLIHEFLQVHFNSPLLGSYHYMTLSLIPKYEVPQPLML